jgi:predicted DCC family thiol-disulfide oxidoreductase YuxK
MPIRLRDGIYQCIARNRLRVFGRREVCYRGDAGYEERFLR